MFHQLFIICVLLIQLILLGCTGIQQRIQFGVSKSLSVKDKYQVYSGESIEISAEGCVGESCQFELLEIESGYLVSNENTKVTFYAKNNFEGNVSLNVTDGVQDKKSIQVQVRKKPTIAKTFLKMAKGNQYLLAPLGGFTPYQFQIVDSENRPMTSDLNLNEVADVSLRPQQKILKAGNTTGNYRIKVTEAKEENPTSFFIDVVVNDQLKLSPDNQILQINESMILNPTGGTETYTLQKLSGNGTVSFDGSQWIYRAPSSGSGTADIQVKDDFDGIGGNNTAQITVNYLPAPDFRLANASDRYTNKSSVSLVVTNCTGSQILLNESETSESGTWLSCPASPGTVNYSFPNSGSGITNGEHKIYLRFKNMSTGVVQNKANLILFYDNVVPQLSNLTIDKTLYRESQNAVIRWSQTETYKKLLQIYYGAGATWSLINEISGSDPGETTWSIPVINVVNQKIKIVATDMAGNQSQLQLANVFEIDSLPPAAPVMSLVKEFISTSELFYKVTNCQGSNNQLKIIIKDFSNNVKHTVSKACSVTSAPTGEQLLLPALSEGFYTFIATLEDAAGNDSVAFEKTFTVDRTSPMGSFTTARGLYSGNKKIELNWNITDNSSGLADGYEIQYSLNGGMNYSTILSGVGVMIHSYNWTPPNITSDTILLRVKATDRAGNVGYVISRSGDYVFDAQKPLITAFAPQSGVTAVRTTSVDWKLSASKTSPASAKIIAYMMSYSDADDGLVPEVSDVRWNPIESSLQNTTVNLTNIRFQIGFVPRVYKIKLWVKDELGNISDVTNYSTFNLTLNPMFAPDVSNYLVSNTQLSGLSQFNPITNSDFDPTVSSKNQMYIYWKVTDADGVLPSNAIGIDYTTDNGLTYINLAENVNPNTGNGCSVVVDTTGCIKLLAPTSSSMVIRLRVRDSDQQVTMANSTILNSGRLRSLAGNVTEGVGGIQSEAVFLTAKSYTDYGAIGNFVMTSNGDLVIIENLVGNLTLVSAREGNKRHLLEYKSGGILPTVASGEIRIMDDNKISNPNAFVVAPQKIGIDKDDQIYLYDSDRIRVINAKNPDFTKWTVKTIIGGGTVTPAIGQVSDAGSIKLYKMHYTETVTKATFTVLSTGKVIFSAMAVTDNTKTMTANRVIGFYNKSTGSLEFKNILADVPLKVISSSLEYTIDPVNSTSIFALDFSYDRNTGEFINIFMRVKNTIIEKYKEPATNTWLSNISDPDCHSCNMLKVNQDPTQKLIMSQRMNINGYSLYGNIQTGLDGKMYYVNLRNTFIARITTDGSISSNGLMNFQLERLYGNFNGIENLTFGSQLPVGRCADGTIAISCSVNIQGLFVDSQSRLFVIDNGQVRTIDENGKVLTLYGQSPFDGDNKLSSDARFTQISSLGVWIEAATNELKVALVDAFAYRIREFSAGKTIKSIAGANKNSTISIESQAVTTDLPTFGVNENIWQTKFMVDTNGEIIKSYSGNHGNVTPLVVLNRATGIWDNFNSRNPDGSKNIPFHNISDAIAEAVDFNALSWGNYHLTVPIGNSDSKMLFMDGNVYRNSTNGKLLQTGTLLVEYDKLTKKARRIAGLETDDKLASISTSEIFCPDLQKATSCVLNNPFSYYRKFQYDSQLGWISFASTKIKAISNDLIVNPIATTVKSISSLAMKRRSSPNNHIVDFWYCNGDTISQVTYNQTTNDKTETNLEWKVSGMKCRGPDLYYLEKDGQKMLIFPYLMNSQYGVGQYLLN